MKRVVSSSIISVIVLLLLAGAFFYFQFKKNFSASVFKLIPGDVAWLVSVHQVSGDLQRLTRTSFFNGSDSVAPFKEWKSTLIAFDSLCRKDEQGEFLPGTCKHHRDQYPLPFGDQRGNAETCGHCTGYRAESQISLLR